MSDKVIKSENIEFIKSAAVKRPEFERFYSPVKGNEDTNGRKKGRTESSSRQAEIASTMEKTKKESYDRGYSEGIKQGTEEEKRRLFQATEALTSTMRELYKLRNEILEGNEEKILNLVFAVSEKIINQEVSASRDIVYSVMKSAMKQVLDKEGIRVRLNPEDYRNMMEINPGIIDSFDDIRNMTVVEDNSIKRGGVVIETSFGEVDARLDQQLHEVRKTISGKK